MAQAKREERKMGECIVNRGAKEAWADNGCSIEVGEVQRSWATSKQSFWPRRTSSLWTWIWSNYVWNISWGYLAFDFEINNFCMVASVIHDDWKSFGIVKEKEEERHNLNYVLKKKDETISSHEETHTQFKEDIAF